MEIVTRREERCLEIILKGELDHHGAHEIAGQLERSIESALPLRLVLDWTGVTFMDSSGIAVVMRARQRMPGAGRQHSPAECWAPTEKGAGSSRAGQICDLGIRRRGVHNESGKLCDAGVSQPQHQ